MAGMKRDQAGRDGRPIFARRSQFGFVNVGRDELLTTSDGANPAHFGAAAQAAARVIFREARVFCLRGWGRPFST